MPAGSLDARIRYANALAQAGDLIPAGLRDGTRANPGKVLLAIETGSMLGLHPVAAINGVNIIDGKATLSPALMSGVVRRAGHLLRIRTHGVLEEGTLRATATLIRSDDPDEPFEATWTPARAHRAGLCTYTQAADGTWSVRARSKSGKPLPWEAYTEALLKARAIGEVCREGAEDALMGVHYTPEELGANVDEHGQAVDIGHVEVVVDQQGQATDRDEPSPTAIASQALMRAAAATTTDELGGVWRALPAVLGRYSWCRDYANLTDYAERIIVPHPAPGSVERISLLAGFTWHKARIEGGGAQGATPAAPAPDDAPTADDVVDGEVEPEQPAATPVEDVHDAETDDDDPWRDGGGMSTPADAERLIAEQLGGRRIDVEGEDNPRARAAAQHAADLERRRRGTPAPVERDAPHEDLGGATPPNGRDAVAAAKAALEQRNEARRAAESAGPKRGTRA